MQDVRSDDALTTVQLLGERLAAADDVGSVVSAVVSGTRDFLGASAVMVGTVDEAAGTLDPLAAQGMEPTTDAFLAGPVVLETGTPAYTVLETREALFWTSREQRDRDFPQYSGFPTSKAAWAILPLIARDRGVGILALGWDEAHEFSSPEARFLSVIAHQCAVALDRAKVLASEREDRATLELLGEGTRLMVSELDPDEIVNRLVRLAVPELAPWCAVYVGEGNVLRRVALEVAAGAALTERLQVNRTVPVGAAVPLAEAYRSGELRVVPRLSREMVEAIYPGRLASDLLHASTGGPWGAIVVPVKASGNTIGVMSLVSNRWGASPNPRVIHAAEGLAGRAGIALAIAGRFLHEHNTAVALTRALLPSGAGEMAGFETATRYLPTGGPVAGDWFDLVAIGPGRYLVGVGDSAGHGMGAASLMAELRAGARALAVAGSPPSMILRQLGHLLMTTAPDEMATALYALVEVGTEVAEGADAAPAQLVWASAGHVPPLLFDPDGARFLATDGAPPLGLLPGNAPRDRELRLGADSGLVLYTDGVVERRRADIDERLEAMRDLVSSLRAAPAHVIADAIIESLCDRPEDDCCLVVLRRAGGPAGPAGPPAGGGPG
jgi:GAF domain-containing protein